MIIRSDIVFLSYLLAGSACAVDTRSSESGRPRGVGPEFAKFYKSTTGKFTCISNPSHEIPFSQVNDDYCDCPDGSDEPGTAACAYLSPLSPPTHPALDGVLPGSSNSPSALPGYWCKNKGHVGAYIRFESVNDGKCDYDVCCDGSDEWAHVGGLHCEDRCKEIGKEWRKKDEVRQKALRGALKRRKELVSEAGRLRKELEMKIEDLEIVAKEFEIKVQEAETSLQETEKAEKLRVIRGGGGATSSGTLGVLIALAKARVEELRNSLATTRRQRDSMLDRVSELESILATFKDEHNPNFNDEGVKRAVRAWEEYAARETDDGWQEAEDRDLDAVMAEDSESNGVNWAEFESSSSDDSDSLAAAESDVAALYKLTAYLPPSLQNWFLQRAANLRAMLVKNGILAEPSSASSTGGSPSDSAAVSAARTVLADAQRSLSSTNGELSNKRRDLAEDYGPDDIMRALAGQCISKSAGEYTYELCFMGATKQKPKKGGADTNLGNFAGFDFEDADDDDEIDPATGKGLTRGRRIVMKHDGGQHCWNGPNRSTKVVLGCSDTDEIWRVSESEKCVYRMEVGTSAVCEVLGDASKGGQAGGAAAAATKDEL